MEEEIKNLKEKMEAVEKEKEEYLNGWKRAKADFVNYQKDELKRLEEIGKFSVADLIREMITVLDSFDLAVTTLEKDNKVERLNAKASPDIPSNGMFRGIYMIRTQLEDALKKRGLERLMVAVGQPFDPAVHEAIAQSESDQPEGTVLEELERGYMLHGRVIRPARVRISKGQITKN